MEIEPGVEIGGRVGVDIEDEADAAIAGLNGLIGGGDDGEAVAIRRVAGDVIAAGGNCLMQSKTLHRK